MTTPIQPFETANDTVAPATATDGTAARIAQLEAENERLRTGWDEAQTFMALALEREERLRADNRWLVDLARNLLARLEEVDGVHPIEAATVHSELDSRVR